MSLRALPLTDKSKPGGRSRESRAPANPFGVWLQDCGMKCVEVAKKLRVSPSSVYNARNGYFRPGLDLALRIEALTGGVVPVRSWPEVKTRSRKSKA